MGAIEEIKKFVAFPGLTPLQPDAYAQPSKRASLSDHPHPSSLPTGRQESIKTKSLPKAVQNEPPTEATDGYLRPVRSLSSGVLPLTLLALPSFSRHGIV